MGHVAVKICGLSDFTNLQVAVDVDVDYVGFVFFPKSPRSVTPEQAGQLASTVPAHVKKVALLVDADDDLILEVMKHVQPDILQLHGSETPDRVAEIKSLSQSQVMKALKIAEEADLDAAKSYFSVCDMLLFDAKAPKDLKNALPGGNGLVFDWRMLQNREFPLPWMLAGGLDTENVEQAVEISGATIVDTSSGAEFWAGVKDPDMIRDFVQKVHSI
ncbi:phosphoribosylanthranilate isomerase [Sneathiella sp. P13V-1]|uniref:phosphoribosylanthranilate isomerase n=1 Tax=Sneathiella sp. P13V-1 TaxID=2697366 RepID=UPI00187B2AE7|nr:phosphoribosylanthranilate isomerase [Sneathiella sp. P13V-1]MBE7636107.1 phosphoribosylanthranilate isomerase [Sneathiella sp. P13V-1]